MLTVMKEVIPSQFSMKVYVNEMQWEKLGWMNGGEF